MQATEDMKLLTTPQLKSLADTASERIFEKQLTSDQYQRLAPEKYHLAIMTVHGQFDVPLVHRVRVMVGYAGKRDPHPVYLDVLAEDWDALPDADWVRDQVRAAEQDVV